MQAAIEGAVLATDFYSKDLDALSEEQLLNSAGGVARKPVDFTYEVALVNGRVACRLNGTDPGPWPGADGFLSAPSELQSKAAISEYFAKTAADMLTAANSIPEEEAGRLVGPADDQEPAFAMLNFATVHTMYHDAQLNFIQSLAGDGAVHWD